jgi:mannitol-specific phosphotransferase system IIBC component
MSNHNNYNGTILGTIGGTLLSVFASVQAGDIIKTLVLATVGAITSFTVSLLLKKAINWRK